jgi:hypothetical protein
MRSEPSQENHPEPANEPVRGTSAESFARALRVALHDRATEGSCEVILFADADVVIHIVAGFEDSWSKHSPPSERQLLVSALFSIGALGKVYLLTPHALEVYKHIEQLSTLTCQRHVDRFVDRFKERLERFLKERGVNELFRDLAGSIHGQSLEEKAGHLLERVRDLPPESFASVEAASGTWPQRLARLTKSGYLVLSGPEQPSTSEIFAKAEVWKIKGLLDRSLVRPAPRLSPNRLRDAAALAILRELILGHGSNPGRPRQVRFYTESRVLIDARRRLPELQKLLRYDGEELRGVGEEASSAFRDVDYFILRASFEALSFPGVAAWWSNRPVVPLKDLQELSASLEKERAQGANLDVVFDRSELHGRPLKEWLEEFESLSFFSSIWPRLATTKVLEDLAEGLTQVLRFTREPESREVLLAAVRHETDQIQGELRNRVQGADVWYKGLKRIEACSLSTLRSPLGTQEVPRMDRDLGMARWGFRLTEDDQESFELLAEPFLDPDDEDWHKGCARLANAIEWWDDERDLTRICALLFWIRSFEQLEQLIDRADQELRAKGQQLGVGFKVLRVASATQEKSRVELAGLARVIEALEQEVDSLSPQDGAWFRVGLAYLYYRGWYAQTDDRHGRSNETGGEPSLTWATKSFKQARRATQDLPRNKLHWTFAVNICAYVGFAAGIELEEAETFEEDLKRVAGDSIENYRFFDTLGFCELQRAVRLLASGTERDAVQPHVLKSRDWFLRARTNFGDPQVPIHLEELDTLARRVGIDLGPTWKNALRRVSGADAPPGAGIGSRQVPSSDSGRYDPGRFHP